MASQELLYTFIGTCRAMKYMFHGLHMTSRPYFI